MTKLYQFSGVKVRLEVVGNAAHFAWNYWTARGVVLQLFKQAFQAYFRGQGHRWQLWPFFYATASRYFPLFWASLSSGGMNGRPQMEKKSFSSRKATGLESSQTWLAE